MESKFLTELDVKYLDDNRCVLLGDLKYRSRIFGGAITVPGGFVSDLASVPRIPVIYAAFGNRAHREAVIHDFLYQTHRSSKIEADRIFLEAMKVRGKKAWVSWGMFLGVVLLGWRAYKTGPKRFQVFENWKIA